MYWPATLPWHEAHNSAGVTELATSWGIAEGRAGNAGNAGSGDEAHDFHTYLLLGNPQSSAADVTVTYLRANGTPIVKTYVVPATASSGPAAPTPSPRGCREFRALLPTPDTHALTHANQVRVWSDATIR